MTTGHLYSLGEYPEGQTLGLPPPGIELVGRLHHRRALYT
jgi:hypothetical protein